MSDKDDLALRILLAYRNSAPHVCRSVIESTPDATGDPTDGGSGLIPDGTTSTDPDKEEAEDEQG